MNNHLEDIIFGLYDDGVKFIICGGLAALLHGVERITVDVDLSLAFDENNIEKFLNAIEKMGMEPRAPVAASLLLEAEERERIVKEKNALVFTFIDKDNPYKQIDVFLIAEYDYRNLENYIEEFVIEDRKIKVLAKDKLIELKRKSGREKDLSDIKELERE